MALFGRNTWKTEESALRKQLAGCCLGVGEPHLAAPRPAPCYLLNRLLELRQCVLRRIPLLRRWVNSADATLKPLGASRSLQPSQARNLLPPPSLPGLRCSGQTSPLNVRRIGGVAMAGKPALASVPVTQEPYRNRDCEDSRAHSFCHAKYTHVSQTLWRGLGRRR